MLCCKHTSRTETPHTDATTHTYTLLQSIGMNTNCSYVRMYIRTYVGTYVAIKVVCLQRLKIAALVCNYLPRNIPANDVSRAISISDRIQKNAMPNLPANVAWRSAHRPRCWWTDTLQLFDDNVRCADSTSLEWNNSSCYSCLPSVDEQNTLRLHTCIRTQMAHHNSSYPCLPPKNHSLPCTDQLEGTWVCLDSVLLHVLVQTTVSKPAGDWKEASISAVRCSYSKLLLKGTEPFLCC